ncbi:unnamed protein product [Thelazia callipaeda]|uniref:Cadherin domain-containing protein n=1 Tax=Thelazia callipaeda TaxID=103827 RepID=A0A0N5CMN6_THECL|nr:unnamed protein product [Thelazia callipaeda]
MGTTVRVFPSLFSNSLQIAVFDDDLKPNMPPAVYEYILTGLGSSIFAVDQRGYVYLNVPHIDTDPPNPSKYELSIEAREVNTIPIRSSEPISITIHILDVNDNPPRFSSSVYVANVSASGTDRPIIEVAATDIDSGENAKIKYGIVSVNGGSNPNFRYDVNTNQLIAVGNLKAGERYEILLEATDGGGLSSRTLIIVYAISENHAGFAMDEEGINFERSQIAGLPNFSALEPQVTSSQLESADSSDTIQTYVTEISEATPPHSIIVTLGNESMGKQMYHTITGGNEDKKFALNSETGTLITVDSFDRENKAFYILQIETRALNWNQHLYWTIVQIAIVDVNDNAPIFVDSQPIRLRVRIDDIHQIIPNMYLGQVNVEDADDGDNGKVGLRIAPPMDKLFLIKDNGAVMVNGNLMNGHFGEHRMTIIAVDHGDPPLETRATLIINIENALEKATIDLVCFSITTNLITVENHSTATSNTLENTDYAENSVDFSQSIQRTFHPISSETLSISMKNALPESTITTPIRKATTNEPLSRLAPVFDPSKFTIVVERNQTNTEIAKLHAYYLDDQPGGIAYVMLDGDQSLFSVNSITGSLFLLRPVEAEEGNSFDIRISTAEATILRTEPNLPHTAVITVDIADTEDWMLNFKLNKYQFKVNANAKLGSVIGQVTAHDYDIVNPSNKVRYRIKGSDTNESYFKINPQTGLLTVNKDLHSSSNRKILLNIEAEDEEIPNQIAETFALIDVEPEKMLALPKTESKLTAIPLTNKLQFSQLNYTIHLSVHSPHLSTILPVYNKPADEHIIACSIISGNYEGLFTISSTADGNCELQVQTNINQQILDYYQLNVSVKTENQVDYATVTVTIVDANNDGPKFIYKNNEYSGYFSILHNAAPSFTHVVTVKVILLLSKKLSAENYNPSSNNSIEYSLNLFTSDSQYFIIDFNGEIQTRLDVPQIIEKSQKDYFSFQVIACDGFLSEEKLCSEADVFVNIVNDSNLFILTARNIQPHQLEVAEKEIASILQKYTYPCNLLFLEKLEERYDNVENANYINMFWCAVNPVSKRSCHTKEYSTLFNPLTVQAITAQLQSQIILSNISDNVNSSQNVFGKNAPSSKNLKTASFAMIVIAAVIAVGALIGICFICLCYTRYQLKMRPKHNSYPNINQIPKFGTVFLPSPPNGSSHDTLYETQMLEMPLGEEDVMIKGAEIGMRNGGMYDLNNAQSYRNHIPKGASEEGNFSIEENMYAISGQTRLNSQNNKKMQRVVIPCPDYPVDQKKSVL